MRSQRLRERVRAIAVPAPRRRRVRMPALLGVVAALTFPQAVGARHSSSGATWTAQVNGVVLYCADHPRPRWWSAPTRPRCWPAEATDSFWFDWAAFHPDTAVWTG